MLAHQPAAAQAIDVDSLFARWDTRDTPGCALGVESRSGTFFKAYGMADLEHDVANSPASVFETGSVSKQFTAAAILLLVQDGKLRLDDDVRNYLPELPDYGSTIRIEHLLTHTSGVRDSVALSNLQGWSGAERAMTQSDVLALVARQRGLNFQPGEEYLYSNSNYSLLAVIVERVSGQPFGAFSAQRIFAPLNMRSTRWQAPGVVKGRSIGYGKGAQGYVQQMPAAKVVGDGGLLTTVGDLLLWNRALNERKLGEFFATEFERQGRLNDGRRIRYARGVRIDSRLGQREVSHSGSNGGFRAWLARYPDAGISIALLCNAADVGSGGDMGLRIAERLLPSAPPPEPGPKGMTYTGGATHAGLFVSERSGRPLTLLVSGDGLVTSGGTKLAPVGESRFRMGGAMVTFEGKDRFRVADHDGNVTEFQRTDPVTAVAPKPYPGRYTSDEVSATWMVEERGGGLSLVFDGRPGQVFALQPSYRDVFLFNTRSGGEPEGIVRFARDAMGRVDAMEMGWNPRARWVRFARGLGAPSRRPQQEKSR